MFRRGPLLLDSNWAFAPSCPSHDRTRGETQELHNSGLLYLFWNEVTHPVPLSRQGAQWQSRDISPLSFTKSTESSVSPTTCKYLGKVFCPVSSLLISLALETTRLPLPWSAPETRAGLPKTLLRTSASFMYLVIPIVHLFIDRLHPTAGSAPMSPCVSPRCHPLQNIQDPHPACRCTPGLDQMRSCVP